MSGPGLNGTAVYYDGRTVVAGSSHETAWHILIAAWNGDVTIVMLRLVSSVRMKDVATEAAIRTITTASIESAMMSRLGRLEGIGISFKKQGRGVHTSISFLQSQTMLRTVLS